VHEKRRYYERIFKKNLSDHSISGYKIIYDGVLAKEIEAIRVNTGRTTNTTTVSEKAPSNMNFLLATGTVTANRYQLHC